MDCLIVALSRPLGKASQHKRSKHKIKIINSTAQESELVTQLIDQINIKYSVAIHTNDVPCFTVLIKAEKLPIMERN